MEDYPELGGQLSVDSKIVVDQVFERAVLKLSKNLALTDVGRRSVCCLLLPAVNDAANNDAADFALPCTTTTRNVQQLELTYSQ
jgi:hypothetical protein